MANPGQTLTVTEGNAKSVPQAPRRPLLVGSSVGGTQAVDTIATYARSDIMRTALGQGEVTNIAEAVIDVAGVEVDVLRTDATVAGASTAVNKTGAGPDISLGGTPTNFFDALVTIVAGGAEGVGTFKYTLDGGQTESEVITIPSGLTYLIPSTGITITFTSGTFVADDTYDWTSIPPTYNGTNLTDAWPTAVNSPTQWPLVFFCGMSAAASAAATIAGTIATIMGQFVTAKKYPRALIHVGDDTASNVLTAFATAVENARFVLVHSKARYAIGSAYQGYASPELPALVQFAMRSAEVKLSTNPGWRGYSSVANGSASLPGTTLAAANYDAERDGSTLHDAKINSLTTMKGRSGVYITNALLKSAAGSGFKYLPWGRVVDETCRVITLAEQPYINDSPTVKTDGTGQLTSGEAAKIDGAVNQQLDAALLQPITDRGTKGHASGVLYAVDQTNDVLATSTMQSTTTIVTKANVEQIVSSVSLGREIS